MHDALHTRAQMRTIDCRS